MAHHLDEDACLDLVCGLLGVTERERALEHIAACPACERMFMRAAGHAERVRARGNIEVLMDGTVTLTRMQPSATVSDQPEFPQKNSRVVPIRRFARFAAVTAAAAAVLLMITVRELHHSPADERLRSLPALGEPVTLRSTPATAADERLGTAAEAYARGDLREVVRRLQNEEFSGQADVLRRIYLGSALARLGDFNGAVAILESIPFESVPDPWGGEARWTLYVALSAIGRTSDADTLLTELARQPGEFGDRARAALGTD